MSFRGIMASQLRRVPQHQGEAIAYRLRTSATGTQPATFGAWVTEQPEGVAITAQISGMQEEVIVDQTRRGTVQKVYARLLIDSAVPIVIGCQVRGADGTIYGVLREMPSGPGLRVWMLGRDQSPVVRGNRGGTVG